jgi:transposase
MKPTPPNDTAEQHVREICRKTRKQYSSEEKIWLVISGLRGEHSIAELCRQHGITKATLYNFK